MSLGILSVASSDLKNSKGVKNVMGTGVDKVFILEVHCKIVLALRYCLFTGDFFFFFTCF